MSSALTLPRQNGDQAKPYLISGAATKARADERRADSNLNQKSQNTLWVPFENGCQVAFADTQTVVLRS